MIGVESGLKDEIDLALRSILILLEKLEPVTIVMGIIIPTTEGVLYI